MSERIKEIAEQVKKWIRTTNFDGMPEDEMTYDEIFQKKFAELIVKECASVARTADLEDVDGGDSAVLRAAANQIAKHFGV